MVADVDGGYLNNVIIQRWKARAGQDKLGYLASKANWSDTETGAY